MRGVTIYIYVYVKTVLISTHTPHARRDILDLNVPYLVDISTHTPHARRDFGRFS